MNKNITVKNGLSFSLIICLIMVMFSCTETDFSKDYTLIDAGLGVNASLTFDANAGTQTVTLSAVPEGAVWSFRKSADWITVTPYNDRLVISTSLYDGLADKKINDVDVKVLANREGSVTLIKEAAGGINVEAGTIQITQTFAVPNNWDSKEETYSWEWNGKDTFDVIFGTHQIDWDATDLDGDKKPYYKYAYKIIGEDVSNFVQTVSDTVRPAPRAIKLTNKEDNTGKEKDAVAYLIVTDKDGKSIHLRRKLVVKYRKGDFVFNPDKVTLAAAGGDVKVSAVSLSAAADKLKCKIKANDVPDWITVPDDVLTGGGDFTIAVKANTSETEAREAVVELVSDTGTPFNPPVLLKIEQNQKLFY
jgi:hypothetical protein